jgi:hypothetical protein
MSRRVVIGLGLLLVFAASMWLGTRIGDPSASRPEARYQITQHDDIIVRLDRSSGAMQTFTVTRSGAIEPLDEVRERRAQASAALDQFLATRERAIQTCVKRGRYVGDCYQQWHAVNQEAWRQAWASARASE